MDVGRFLEFIYLSLLIISVNFPDQLVTDISKPVLEDELTGNGSLMIVILLHKEEGSLYDWYCL